ncbi:MAG: peptidyl-alpha-hydroxyglycine alpha-amidating lyase family protein [Thermodesulfobacteriota bacterium]|jgi:DNA-binding beta-propeller fold protein YncE
MARGSNKIEYEVLEGWEQLPEGWSFVEVAGVATDSQDRVYAFNRGAHPVIVFDRDGKFLTAWGEGVFTNPHGIFIGPDDRVYCADNFDHTVRIFTPDGTLLHTLGEKHRPSDTGFKAWETPVQRAAGPFNMVTNVALAPDGNLYVADGYGNARVHVFSPAGALLFSWGEPGTGPGQFRLPHAIAVDRRGRVYVADRENSRIQVFTSQGAYLTQWTHVQRPDDLYIDADENLFVAELGFLAGVMPTGFGATVPPHVPHARVSVLTLDGEVQTQFGGEEPCAPGNFFAPHGIWADSRGDLYVSEVNYSAGGRRGLVPLDCHSLQKFVKVH